LVAELQVVEWTCEHYHAIPAAHSEHPTVTSGSAIEVKAKGRQAPYRDVIEVQAYVQLQIGLAAWLLSCA
jgi:hypothetical protein